MSSKLLGKVMAGAGLGAAALLICAPGTALADDAPPKHEHNKGFIYTEPKGVKPGHKFKIFLRCVHPVDRPWVSSKITGKLWLKPVAEENGNGRERPQQPENGGQPDEDGQPSLPPDDGQPSLPPDDGQPSLPPQDGQAPLQENGQPPADTDVQPEGGEGGQAAYRYDAKYWAWAKVPLKIKPGHYAAKGSCGNGKIVVLPKGSVPGGDGGISTDSSRTVAGAGLLGAAAVGGFLMIRRRRTDGSPA
jgi:MYXO-CTERM domain-containing protein